MFNHNTIYFLKKSYYNKSYNFYSFFNKYCEFLEKNNLNDENFVIDNGGVLSLYGIRDAHDLDFISTQKIICNEENIDCMTLSHIHEFKKLNLTIESIVNNPENFFYYNKKKILDIKILKKFKYNRTKNIVNGQTNIRSKDITDYNYIQELLMD